MSDRSWRVIEVAGSDPEKPSPDEPLIPGAGMAGPRRIHRVLEFGVVTLGGCVRSLVLPLFLLGLYGIATTFGRGQGVGEGAGAAPPLFWVVAPPVVFTVLVPWLCYRLGRGLRELSPGARWVALVLVTTACVPLLVLVFGSLRAGFDFLGIWAAVLLVFPATAALVLAASPSDLVFGAEHRALTRTGTEPSARPLSNLIVLLFWVVLVVMIALIASGG